MPTNGMTIDSLNTVSALTAQDEVPVWDKEASGEPTRKITAQNLTNSVKTLGDLVNTTEMNDAIAQSTAIQVCPISAAQQISTGNFSISFTVSKSGYMPIGVIGYNLGDRALGGKVNITGFEIANSSTIMMYGNVSTGVTLPVNCSISVLYSKA